MKNEAPVIFEELSEMNKTRQEGVSQPETMSNYKNRLAETIISTRKSRLKRCFPLWPDIEIMKMAENFSLCANGESSFNSEIELVRKSEKATKNGLNFDRFKAYCTQYVPVFPFVLNLFLFVYPSPLGVFGSQ